MDWYVYQMSQASLGGWRNFGIGSFTDNKIKHLGDISTLTKALSIISECKLEYDWFNKYHEFWITPCPGARDFVCIRFDSTPFSEDYIISAIPLPHLKFDKEWKVVK